MKHLFVVAVLALHTYHSSRADFVGEHSGVGQTNRSMPTFVQEWENEGTVGTSGLSHWGLHGAARSRDGAGSSWYTRAFDFLAEGYAIRGFQVGLGGTWLLPDGKFDRSKCPCGRKGAYGWCSDGTCRNRGGCADVWETMEGGLGYWRGELPTSKLKWRLNNVNGCYAKEMMGVLFDFYGHHISCEDMGFVIVSNRLIMAPDGLSFGGSKSGDYGMLGQAFMRSTIGRTGPSSHTHGVRGAYTYMLVLDAANFAGPVGYTLEEYWRDNKGYDAAPDFSRTKIKIGSTGFEFNGLSAFTSYQNFSDQVFMRIPKLQFPVAEDLHTTILTGVREWNLDVLQEPLEAALAGAALPKTLLKLGKGSKGRCRSGSSLIALGYKGLPTIHLGGVLRMGSASTSDECVSEIAWDKGKMPCKNKLPAGGGTCSLPEFWEVSSPLLAKPKVDWSTVDCAASCKKAGYCCNGRIGIGSNQYLSCLQACDMRQHGADEKTCLGHCDEVAQHRGCTRTINGRRYNLCSTCSDILPTSKCEWGVGGKDACTFGCTFQQYESKTPFMPVILWSKVDCVAKCKAAKYCCNSDIGLGSNRKLSCLQACDIRKHGTDQQTCLGYCDKVAKDKPCSRSINGRQYNFCGSCTDIDPYSPKCKWGVWDKSACTFGCTLQEEGAATAISGERTAKPSSANALPSWSTLQKKRFPEKTYANVPKLDGLSGASGTCMTNPGPASRTVFCVKTGTGSYLGYQWYKFVDQPALQRSRLTEQEKRYLQLRIERLHTLLEAEAPINRWMEAPAEAQPLAELDPNLLVTPPARFKVGYVPIAVYEGGSSHLCDRMIELKPSAQSSITTDTSVCTWDRPMLLPILASAVACVLIMASFAAVFGNKWRRAHLGVAVSGAPLLASS